MNDFTAFRQTFMTILRWWWLIIIAVLVGAAMGYVFSSRQPRVYQSSTTLIVGQTIQATQLDSKDILTSEQLAYTYVNIARRQPVLQATVETLNLDRSWNSLKDRVFVRLIDGTQLFEIRVEASSAEEAQRTADEIARQLILKSPTAALQDQENNESNRFVNQQLEYLQKNIQAGQVRIAELQDTIAESLFLNETQQTRRGLQERTLSTTEIQTVQDEIDALETLIARWQANYAQLSGSVPENLSSNYLSVIETAQLERSPIRPNVTFTTLLAGAAGLVLALGAILLRERLNDTLKTEEDLDDFHGLTYLGGIGRIKRRNHPIGLSAPQGFLPVSEAYRMIRIMLQSKSTDWPIHSILMTSPKPHEGTSVAVTNLGIAIAQTGAKTILVDCNLSQPMLHQIFEIPQQDGLTDLLHAPELDISCYLKNTHVENLQVLTAGDWIRTNSSELFSSPHMRQLLAHLGELADVVILDSAPTLAVADAAILATQVDGVVLVMESGKTRRDDAKHALFYLQQVGARMLGTILNGVRANGDRQRYGAHTQIRGKVARLRSARDIEPELPVSP